MPSMLRPSSRGQNSHRGSAPRETVLRPVGFRGRGSAARLGAACVVQSVPRVAADNAANHGGASITCPHPVRNWCGVMKCDQLVNPPAREHVLSVILDVVKRYEIYEPHHVRRLFLSLPEKDAAGRTVNFPDDASWRNGAASGMAREEWRRANVNQFIENTCHSIHALKPWVKFGISPFHLASVASEADSRFGRLRENLRRFAPLARQRLARLSFTATVASDGHRNKVFPSFCNGGRGKTPNIAIFGRPKRVQCRFQVETG